MAKGRLNFQIRRACYKPVVQCDTLTVAVLVLGHLGRDHQLYWRNTSRALWNEGREQFSAQAEPILAETVINDRLRDWRLYRIESDAAAETGHS